MTVAVGRKKRRGNKSSRRLEVITFNIGGGKVKHRKLEGRDHLVVPCVMITEGVHNGSNGPGLYLEKDTAKTVVAWDHMPIVVYHPQNESGHGVSARQPDVLNTRKVGLVLNTRWNRKTKKLRAEAWLDYERTKEVDNRIIEAVEKGEKVEVSTGLFLRRQKKKGTFNSKKYTWIARDQTPDHLAVLPDEVGACSIEDGAGLLQLNHRLREPEGTATVLTRGITNALKSIGVEVTNNELSLSERSRCLSDLLAKTYGERGTYWRGYVVDVYDEYVVFADKDKMYSVSYTAEDDEIALDGKPVEVTRVVEYQAKKGGKTYAANGKKVITNNREPATMLPLKKKTRMVNRLINNSSVWSSKHRKELLKMNDEVFKTIYRSAITADADDPETDAVQNTVKKEADKSGFKTAGKKKLVKNKTKELDEDEILKKLSPERRAVLNQGLKTLRRRKDELIDIISNNESNKFSDKWLEKQEIDVLEGMAELARNAEGEDDDVEEEDGIFKSGYRPDYSGAAGHAPVGNRRTRRGRDDNDDVPSLDLPSLYRGEEELVDNEDGEDDDDRPRRKKNKTRRTA